MIPLVHVRWVILLGRGSGFSPGSALRRGLSQHGLDFASSAFSALLGFPSRYGSASLRTPGHRSPSAREKLRLAGVPLQAARNHSYLKLLKGHRKDGSASSALKVAEFLVWCVSLICYRQASPVCLRSWAGVWFAANETSSRCSFQLTHTCLFSMKGIGLSSGLLYLGFHGSGHTPPHRGRELQLLIRSIRWIILLSNSLVRHWGS